MRWRIVTVVACVVVMLRGGAAKVVCPVPSQACDCQDTVTGFVLCTGMESLPKNLPGTVNFLVLDSNQIGSSLLKIQMENLSNLTLKQLYLSNTGLEAIEYQVFVTQPKIETLDLSNNNFRSLEGQIFYGLVHLNALLLTQSSIYDISSIVFTYTPSLAYLDLGGNMISRITSEFSSLSNLQTLLLSDNKIFVMDGNAFQSQSRLERLDLYGNQLQTPDKAWFQMLAANNGTLRIHFQSQKENPWTCCGGIVTEYRAFLDSLPQMLNSRQQYDILCSSPEKFSGQKIENLDTNELNLTTCEATTISRVTEGINGTSSSTGEENESGTFVSGEIITDGRNIFSDLADGHIVLILIAIIVMAVIVTAIVAFQYCSRSKRNKLDTFINNLPNARAGDSDDDAALTTKTYRHDAPVYGSTGNVVDRHMNGTPISHRSPDYQYTCDIPRNHSDFRKSDSDNSLDIAYDTPPRSLATERRKPPPYDPPPTSPIAGEQEYEQTQFNNSSSVGLAHRFYSSTNRNTFDNLGYDSDISDDLWDISTLR